MKDLPDYSGKISMNPREQTRTERKRPTEKDARSTVADTALFSEFSLKKDWQLPEEDEAWNNL
jgi:hypothetical protein